MTQDYPVIWCNLPAIRHLPIIHQQFPRPLGQGGKWRQKLRANLRRSLEHPWGTLGIPGNTRGTPIKMIIFEAWPPPNHSKNMFFENERGQSRFLGVSHVYFWYTTGCLVRTEPSFSASTVGACAPSLNFWTKPLDCWCVICREGWIWYWDHYSSAEWL